MKLKRFFYTVFCLVILSVPGVCQENSPADLTPGYHDFDIELYDYEQWAKQGEAETYYSFKEQHIGRNFINYGSFTTYRTNRVVFYLSNTIPQVAESLSEVKLIYYIYETELYGFHHFKVGYDPANNWRCTYDKFTDEIIYTHTGIPYGSATIEANALIPILTQTKSKNLYLFAMSESEAADYPTYAKLSLRVTGKYFIPKAKVKLTVKNNFAGGHVKVGIEENAIERPSPYENSTVDEMSAVNMEAVEEPCTGFNSHWKSSSQWTKQLLGSPELPYAVSKSTTYNTIKTESDVTFKANMKKSFDVNVQRSSQGGGIIQVTLNGTQTTVPASGQTFPVLESNTITAAAITETINNIDYEFDKWEWTENGVTREDKTTNPKTFNPNYHTNITCYFKGYPNISMMNVQDNHLDTTVSPNITWTDNPNTNVSYKVDAKMFKRNSPTTYIIFNPTYVSKGEQIFTISSYGANLEYTEGDFLIVDLTALYGIENTKKFVTERTFTVHGQLPDNENPPASKKNSGVEKEIVITKYAVANFPNPFNPATVINYQVPETGYITLKVYDVMGKEIANLFDGVKAKGNHNINFSMDQYHLASGIYFCRLSAGKNVVTTKMILSK